MPFRFFKKSDNFSSILESTNFHVIVESLRKELEVGELILYLTKPENAPTIAHGLSKIIVKYAPTQKSLFFSEKSNVKLEYLKKLIELISNLKIQSEVQKSIFKLLDLVCCLICDFQVSKDFRPAWVLLAKDKIIESVTLPVSIDDNVTTRKLIEAVVKSIKKHTVTLNDGTIVGRVIGILPDFKQGLLRIVVKSKDANLSLPIEKVDNFYLIPFNYVIAMSDYIVIKVSKADGVTTYTSLVDCIIATDKRDVNLEELIDTLTKLKEKIEQAWKEITFLINESVISNFKDLSTSLSHLIRFYEEGEYEICLKEAERIKSAVKIAEKLYQTLRDLKLKIRSLNHVTVPREFYDMIKLAENAKTTFVEFKELVENAKMLFNEIVNSIPQIKLEIENLKLSYGWNPLKIKITNEGYAHAYDLTLSLSDEVEFKKLEPITVKGLESVIVEIPIKPKEFGKIPLEITVKYLDGKGKQFEKKTVVWIESGTKIGKLCPYCHQKLPHELLKVCPYCFKVLPWADQIKDDTKIWGLDEESQTVIDDTAVKQAETVVKSDNTKVKSNRCPNCGYEVQPEWVACPSCGYKLKP